MRGTLIQYYHDLRLQVYGIIGIMREGVCKRRNPNCFIGCHYENPIKTQLAPFFCFSIRHHEGVSTTIK